MPAIVCLPPSVPFQALNLCLQNINGITFSGFLTRWHGLVTGLLFYVYRPMSDCCHPQTDHSQQCQVLLRLLNRHLERNYKADLSRTKYTRYRCIVFTRFLIMPTLILGGNLCPVNVKDFIEDVFIHCKQCLNYKILGDGK